MERGVDKTQTYKLCLPALPVRCDYSAEPERPRVRFPRLSQLPCLCKFPAFPGDKCRKWNPGLDIQYDQGWRGLSLLAFLSQGSLRI